MTDLKNGFVDIRIGEKKNIFIIQPRQGSKAQMRNGSYHIKKGSYHMVEKTNFEPRKVATSRHLQQSNDSLISRICFSPRNAFKFHSRLIAIFFCSLFSILFVILNNAIIIGPLITSITSSLVYYWQLYAPIITTIEGLFNLVSSTNNFDVERIKSIVEIFQE